MAAAEPREAAIALNAPPKRAATATINCESLEGGGGAGTSDH